MSSANGERVRVLHVDDEARLRELTRTFLEREHGRLAVETAAAPEAALDRLDGDTADGGTADADAIDCVVSDYAMSGMDGIELLRAVREEHPNLPFVLFTGKGSEAVASEAISAGVTDYLQKRGGTEQFELLANRVANAVEGRRAADALRRTEQRYETIIETVTDAIYTVDGRGRFSSVNGAFCELTEYSEGELVGADVALVKDEPTVERFEAAVREMLRGDAEDVVVEFELLTATGDRVACEDHMTLLPFEDEYQGAAGIIRDVSGRVSRAESTPAET
jgi:PAS domain S-box-containing protein